MSKNPSSTPSSSELTNLENRLKEINPKLFEGLDKKKKETLIKSVSYLSLEMTRISPIPDPATLERYDAIIPDGANRIMKMAEKQQDHRINLEKIAVSGQMKESRRGQVFAFIIGLIGMIGAIGALLMGFEISGLILAFGTIATLMATFLKGRRSQRENLEKKRANEISSNPKSHP